MFSSTIKGSFAALAVVVGLLAVAGPASAQGGGADFTRGPHGYYTNEPTWQVMDDHLIWHGYANPTDRPASTAIEQFNGPEWSR